MNGVAWSAIGLLAAMIGLLGTVQIVLLQHLLGSHQNLSAHMDAGFAAVYARFDTRFDAVNARMDAGFATVNARVDQLSTRIDDHIGHPAH